MIHEAWKDPIYFYKECPRKDRAKDQREVRYSYEHRHLTLPKELDLVRLEVEEVICVCQEKMLFNFIKDHLLLISD